MAQAPTHYWMIAAHVVLALVMQSATHIVGATESYQRVTDAIMASRPGDTILVRPGLYRERVTIPHSVVVIGSPDAIIDGGGQGQILVIHAPAVIRGLTIRNSGSNLSREDAGIWVDGADGMIVEDNTLEDVLFGIYVKQSRAVIVRNNRIVGKDLPAARRGDGIRLWYSRGGSIDGNVVTQVRDVVIWFSDSVSARNNEITDSRYGLHYMYSNHNTFEDNRFLRNEVGAFLMYSRHIQFHNNVFAYARGGLGKGLGFKDSEAIVASHNVIVKNAAGIYLDNSPLTHGVTNTFDQNVIAFNDAGVSLLPSVAHNTFRGNAFIDNVQPVVVSGGGSALANGWRGNFWSDYAGFDENGDGRGDSPYQYERLVDEFFAKHDDLKVFQLSLSAATLNAVGRLVPLLKPQPILVDSTPRIARPDLDVPQIETSEKQSVAAVVAWLVVLSAATATAGALGRPLRKRS